SDKPIRVAITGSNMAQRADNRSTRTVAGRLLAATAALAVAHAGPGITALHPVRASLFPLLSGKAASDHVALTFDDGPDPMATPLFLDLLSERGVRATFFLLGSQVSRSPRLAAAIADA